MLVFQDMSMVKSGQAAIFENLDKKESYFLKFYFFSDYMYFQLPWFQQRAVADVLNMQKMKITLSHKHHNGQIFYTSFRTATISL